MENKGFYWVIIWIDVLCYACIRRVWEKRGREKTFHLSYSMASDRSTQTFVHFSCLWKNVRWLVNLHTKIALTFKFVTEANFYFRCIYSFYNQFLIRCKFWRHLSKHIHIQINACNFKEMHLHIIISKTLLINRKIKNLNVCIYTCFLNNGFLV